MEDFDIFTNEINFTKPAYKNLLNKLVYEIPTTSNGQNYQRGRKQLAVESLADNDELQGTFHLSEAVSATIRIMADYREDQRSISGNKLQNILRFIKPVQDIVDSNPIPSKQKSLSTFLTEDVSETLKEFQIDEDLPFHKRYLRFTKENNAENFCRILKELPKEWTVVQLTAPYNAKDNFTLVTEYRTEVPSIFLSVFTNDYLDDFGPFTINVPANVTKGEEKPLFTELYSTIEANYNTINNAQFLNNKRLVQNYWSRREDIDLRMKSLINVMEKEWIGIWGGLLTGKLVDEKLKEKVIRLVDDAITDWGFIKLTRKQRMLLYNLMESSPNMTSHQVRSCIRRILTEHGNTEDLRQVLSQTACECIKEFKFANELCLKCLSKCFEKIHNFSLVDGIKAFYEVATQVKDSDDWAALKKAKRHPVILIVDEILDTFPWENLPILIQHPVTRIENIHFLYYLYKLHEKHIVNGYFHTKGHEGRYVINPEKNLDRMQQRMSSFVRYWCEGWCGAVGEAPKADDFLTYLATSDIFLYCGHGDGCHFANGSSMGVESSPTGALCVLSGCCSARLQPANGAHQAAYRHLHIAGSPTVVGMLWEVTDLEVDKMVTTLLSLCVPSRAPLPWHAVGKTNWSQGKLDTSVSQPGSATLEPRVPRAVCRARAATHYTMIASCLVVRGLPACIT